MRKMRKMKAIKLLLLSMLTMVMACEKEDNEESAQNKPLISDFIVESEAGKGDTLQLGGIISFEFNAEMTSDDKLKSYHLEIHDEPESGLAADEYKIIDQTYNDVSGLRNTHIHDHIEVPIEANKGKYHFHLTVISQNGYSSTKEAYLFVGENPNAPDINDFSVTNKNGNTAYRVGDTIVISFSATAGNDASLKEYELEIHDEPESGDIEDEYKLVDDRFIQDFQGKDTAVIAHKIKITDGGEKGPYHVHLHVYDNKYNGAAKTDEIEIE